jgi:glycosyltransferase involved in cell wall biosynthesis
MLNYNKGKFIRQAIDSVLSQKTNFDYQIVISDDNSTDNSLNIIKEYASKYSNIYPLLSNDNERGILKNLIRAYSLTKTDYFCVLDPDDYWTDENRLQRAFDFFETHPEYTIYFTNILCSYEDEAKLSYKYFREDGKKEASFSQDNIIDWSLLIPQTSGAFFRNVIFKKGVPDIMSKAVGTISEASFRADAGRFMMHLQYGKAKYVNNVESVYRLGGGVWTSLSLFEQNTLNAQIYLDYNEFYNNKYKAAFFLNAYEVILKAIDCFKNDIVNKSIKPIYLEMFTNVLKNINNEELMLSYMRKREIENEKRIKLMSFKQRLRLKVFKYLYKKLHRKGLV